MFVITKNAEAKLLEAAVALKDDPHGYYALWFQFSQLQESNSSEYQLKIAINILHDLFKEVDGGAFICKDKDLFLITKDCGKALIEKAIFQLRYLFSEDPLAYRAENQENEQFCVVFDLGFHAQEFAQRCKRKMSGGATAEITQSSASSPNSAAPLYKSITPALLERVETELEKIDIRHAMRKQPICAVVKGKALQPVFHEMYVHIDHLKRLLPLDVNLTSDRVLFSHLTQALDKQMLAIIRHRPGFYFRDALSLNFNVATLLSRSFAELNALIAPATRASIVIEIGIGDVFADILGFFTAKRFLKSQGYRLCLDGVNSYSLPLVNREQLGFDLVKLQWNAETEGQLNVNEYRQLGAIVEKYGKNRVILTRCDSKYAVDYGQGLGLSLFQGRYLDKMLNPNAKVEN